MITELYPRINLGCGRFPLEGYTNIDEQAEEADLLCDAWELEPPTPAAEVRMDHFLEHVSWRRVPELLQRAHGWLRPGGLLVVEVPDMTAILERGTSGDWQRYIYGSQQHEGEYHRSGFTALTLKLAIERAGFVEVEVFPLISTFQTRPGMPCLKATGRRAA